LVAQTLIKFKQLSLLAHVFSSICLCLGIFTPTEIIKQNMQQNSLLYNIEYVQISVHHKYFLQGHQRAINIYYLTGSMIYM